MHIGEKSSVSKDIDILRLKYKNIPQIFYLNLNKREDKRKYTEDQFNILKIKNFTRVSADRFSVKTFDVWKNKFYKKPVNEISRLSTTLNQLKTIIDWYDSNSSECCIIAEDDVNYLTAKYWPFTWEQFFKKLPCNWDCVQLHIIGEYFIPMGLTDRTRNNHSAACYLINRNYAAKLKQMHYKDEKFVFYNNYGYNDSVDTYHYQSADFVPYEIGVTYSFPIFITKSDLISDSYVNSTNYMARESDLITISWWKNLENSNYSMDDIFTRDSDKRKELTPKVQYVVTQ